MRCVVLTVLLILIRSLCNLHIKSRRRKIGPTPVKKLNVSELADSEMQKVLIWKDSRFSAAANVFLMTASVSAQLSAATSATPSIRKLFRYCLLFVFHLAVCAGYPFDVFGGVGQTVALNGRRSPTSLACSRTSSSTRFVCLDE